jgi:hypothetical protein
MDMQLWVARDKRNNKIHLYLLKPVRDKDCVEWVYPDSDELSKLFVENPELKEFYDSGCLMHIQLLTSAFPNLKWEDEPLQCMLSIAHDEE